MEVISVKVLDYKTGLVTQGVTAELDESCRVAHQQYLKAHNLTYWQLVILRVFGTHFLVVFSCPAGENEIPNYKLVCTSELTDQIPEILEAHYTQWVQRASKP